MYAFYMSADINLTSELIAAYRIYQIRSESDESRMISRAEGRQIEWNVQEQIEGERDRERQKTESSSHNNNIHFMIAICIRALTQ